MCNMKKSREEINFLRLLSKTEERVSNAENGKHEWQVEKYLESLQDRLVELSKHPQRPSNDTLKEYRTKLQFLTKVIESTKPPKDAAHVNDRGVTAFHIGHSEPLRLVPHGPASTRDTITKEIHQKTTERYNTTAREELLGGTDAELRQRFTSSMTDRKDGDFDDLMKAHHQAQEQIAEEMLTLTRALKDQTLAANEIIKKDTDKLEQASDMADRNTEKLATESDRLSQHTGSMCRCWIWFLLAIVFMTFIAMVWIMKFFRKRQDMTSVI